MESSLQRRDRAPTVLSLFRGTLTLRTTLNHSISSKEEKQKQKQRLRQMNVVSL